MLLTDKIKSCTTAIQRRRTAQEGKQSAEAYALALRQLEIASEKLKTTLTCAAAMKEKGLVDHPILSIETRDDLLECVMNCGNGLSDSSITMDTVRVLQAKSDEFSRKTGSEWKTEAAKYAEGVQGYLSMIGGLTSEPQKARDLNEKIDRIIRGQISIASIDSLIQNVAQAKQITDSFSLNPQIEAFLQKVSKRQATILDLSPEILEWLKEQNLCGKLKIGF